MQPLSIFQAILFRALWWNQSAIAVRVDKILHDGACMSAERSLQDVYLLGMHDHMHGISPDSATVTSPSVITGDFPKG